MKKSRRRTDKAPSAAARAPRVLSRDMFDCEDQEFLDWMKAKENLVGLTGLDTILINQVVEWARENKLEAAKFAKYIKRTSR